MKDRLTELWKGFFPKKYFVPRLVACVLAVITMGFSLSLLILVDMGLDPCTLMNVNVSQTIGFTLGNWQALFNTVLFVIIIWAGAKNIGLGTIANMFLVGYSIDFFSWIWSMVLPVGLFDSMVVKVSVLIPALIVFIFAVAIYIDMDMGTSPYDAMPSVIKNHFPKLSYTGIRIVYDGAVTLAGMLFGGKIGIVTIFMIIALGPVIEWVSALIKKKWDFSEA